MGELPQVGALGGVFLIVLWLVKVLVDRSGSVEAAAAKRTEALETRWSAELSRTVLEADERCRVQLEAMRGRIKSNEAVTRALAAQYPENAPLQFLVSMIPLDPL